MYHEDFEAFQVGVDPHTDWFARAIADGVVTETADGQFEVDQPWADDGTFTVSDNDWVTLHADGHIVRYDADMEDEG